MPLPPALTAEQRQAALEKAAEARRQRAEVKAKLKQGSLGLGELFDQGTRDDALAKLKVVSVLESLPGVGKVKARRTMEEIGISVPAHLDHDRGRYVIDCPFPVQFDEEPRRWLLEAVSREIPTPEHIAKMGTGLRDLARSNNGIYDGWWASEPPEDEEVGAPEPEPEPEPAEA